MRFERKPGWRQRLDDYLDTVEKVPFAYGRHDCGLFIGNAVLAMTRDDPAAEIRGRYSSHTGLIRILRKMGFVDHIAFVASMFKEIHPSECQIGDIAVIETENGLVLSLVGGSRLIGPMAGTLGLGNVSRLMAVRAFEVPPE